MSGWVSYLFKGYNNSVEGQRDGLVGVGSQGAYWESLETQGQPPEPMKRCKEKTNSMKLSTDLHM